MEYDLSKRLPKVFSESERSVLPDETIKRAQEAALAVGVEMDIQTFVHGGVFWTSRMSTDYKVKLPQRVRHFRLAGKGPSEKQAVASCAMEFIERWSLYRFASQDLHEHVCVDLKSGKPHRLVAMSDIFDTKCVAAGNNYEEAILHCLHELIETRSGSHPNMFEPFKLIRPDQLFDDLPEWVDRSIVLIKTPCMVDEFYHITALKYPSNGRFDPSFRDRLQEKDDLLVWHRACRGPKDHSPNSGGAAGLSPRMTAFRAMNEVFQGDYRELHDGRTKPLPPGFPVAAASDLVDNETDSITSDILKILDLLGEDVFVGVIDVTDPELDIPVVKLVSDWSPAQSLVSRKTMSLFFDFQ